MSMFGTSDIGTQMQTGYNGQVKRQNQGLGNIDQAFTPFNQNYFNQIGQQYMNNALPGLQQQGIEGQHMLGYNMANRGLYNSSPMQVGQTGLAHQMTAGRQDLTNNSLNYQNAIQQLIAQQKARLSQQLQTANQPYAMQQQLLGQAAQMGAPSPLASIGQAAGGIGNLAAFAAMA
jgi:hypothetical protein